MDIVVKEGGKCTTFLHRLANSHRGNNAIETLTIDGLVSSKQFVIKDHIVGHFKELFLEPFYWRPTLDGLSNP